MLRSGGRRATAAAVVVVGVVTVVGGLLAGHAVAETGTPSPAALAAWRQPLVPGTPCSVTARACVDLESQQAWLVHDGTVVRGPVGISSGDVGQETPVGHSFRVYRKEPDHRSQESRLPNGDPAPMPWSVFFADGGIAFHSGDPEIPSAGCIHVPPADAKAWFDHLQIGDQVQVVKASEEHAARAVTVRPAARVAPRRQEPPATERCTTSNSSSADAEATGRARSPACAVIAGPFSQAWKDSSLSQWVTTK